MRVKRGEHINESNHLKYHFSITGKYLQNKMNTEPLTDVVTQQPCWLYV